MSELKKYFVTGIGTEVGKTICSAILVEALKANYWKPIQAGDLDWTDTMKVINLISNNQSIFFQEQYKLSKPVSPHAAAHADQIEINLSNFVLPDSQQTLIIEGAGGLMVPLNQKGDLVIDLIAKLNAEVILVSQNYLGSINHTLLSIEALKTRQIGVAGIIFNGHSNAETEEIILKLSGLKCLGKIPHASIPDQKFILEQALQFKSLNESFN